MKDSELRGMVLQKYYERRNTMQFTELTGSDFNEMLSLSELRRMNKQLCDYQYISWDNTLNMQRAGLGMITPRGIDVIEGSINPSIPMEIKIDYSQHNITLSHLPSTTNIQIGNGNTSVHGINIDVQKLMNAINNSGASKYEIEEAQSMIEKVFNLPLVKKMIGKITSKGK